MSAQYSRARVRSAGVDLSGVFTNMKITIKPKEARAASVNLKYRIRKIYAVGDLLPALAFIKVVESQRSRPVGRPFNKIEP